MHVDAVDWNAHCASVVEMARSLLQRPPDVLVGDVVVSAVHPVCRQEGIPTPRAPNLAADGDVRRKMAPDCADGAKAVVTGCFVIDTHTLPSVLLVVDFKCRVLIGR